MRAKTTYQTVYIADDGTEFDDRQACIDYENTILQTAEDRFMERITNCPELVDFPPFDGGEHSEFNKYLWIKPDNCVFATTLNESIDYARKVLKELGYEMIIKEADKNE